MLINIYIDNFVLATSKQNLLDWGKKSSERKIQCQGLRKGKNNHRLANNLENINNWYGKYHH